MNTSESSKRYQDEIDQAEAERILSDLEIELDQVADDIIEASKYGTDPIEDYNDYCKAT